MTHPLLLLIVSCNSELVIINLRLALIYYTMYTVIRCNVLRLNSCVMYTKVADFVISAYKNRFSLIILYWINVVMSRFKCFLVF